MTVGLVIKPYLEKVYLWRPVAIGSVPAPLILGFTFFAGIPYNYVIHRSHYTYAHVLENTLV